MVEFAEQSLRGLFSHVVWWQFTIVLAVSVYAVLKQKVGQFLFAAFLFMYAWVVYDYGRHIVSDAFKPAAFGVLVGLGIFVGITGIYVLFLRSEF